MDRREFLKICGDGLLTLFLSGCDSRSLVESSKFPEQARQIGANL